MKRSEMIEKIAKRLGPIGISEETCREVLDIIEEAGMAPPKITIMPDQYNREQGSYGFEVHEWEEE